LFAGSAQKLQSNLQRRYKGEETGLRMKIERYDGWASEDL
jgi:hypothetical protein